MRTFRADRIVLVLASLALCHGFLADDGTCAGRCSHGYNPSLPCQCNSLCSGYGNCCDDFNRLCQDTSGGTSTSIRCEDRNTDVTCSTSFNDVTEALWCRDVNRLDSSMYTLNFQTKVSVTNDADHASAPFFTDVDASVLTSRPTLKTLLALQDNYNPINGAGDALSSRDTVEIDQFLNEVLQTPVMNILLEYLKCRNILSDKTQLRTRLMQLWFNPFTRRHEYTHADSSGFEHVMVGEYKSATEVNGLHNWLAFYTKERNHDINYYGYVARAEPNLVALNYDWNGRLKEVGGFFVGTSPEFDLALYTLCALTNHSSVQLNGHSVHIQVWDVLHVDGLQIASAYPSF